MFGINEMVKVNNLNKKGTVITIEFDNGHIDYVVELENETEIKTTYENLSYLSHGYNF